MLLTHFEKETILNYFNSLYFIMTNKTHNINVRVRVIVQDYDDYIAEQREKRILAMYLIWWAICSYFFAGPLNVLFDIPVNKSFFSFLALFIIIHFLPNSLFRSVLQLIIGFFYAVTGIILIVFMFMYGFFWPFMIITAIMFWQVYALYNNYLEFR